MRYGYARVSTKDQNLNLQLDALEKAGCDRIFTDRISGKSRSRPGLDSLLAGIENKDATVVVWRLDRLGRSFFDLVRIAEELQARGVNIVSLTEGFDTGTPIGEAVYRLICIFADLERENIVERTKAGLEAARRRGVRLGRPRKLSARQAREAGCMMRTGVSAEAVAHSYGVGRATLFRARARIRSAA